MKSIPVHEKSSKHGVRIAVAVTAGAAALVAGMNLLHDNSRTPTKSEQHSISYLNSDEMEEGIQVAYGDTPERIVQVVNGNHLSGQALLDAEDFVAQQGVITETLSDGTVQHDLYGGQIVKAPVMSDQQIQDVNSGKID